MPTETYYFFLQGWTALGFLACAAFFLRFWVRSRDRLFAIFALAFAIFAVNRVAQVFLDSHDEFELVVYGARALAFALIIAAILDKNRAAQPERAEVPAGATEVAGPPGAGPPPG